MFFWYLVWIAHSSNSPAYKDVIVEEVNAQFIANADQKFVDEILKRQKTRWQNFAIDPSKKYQSNIGAVFFWAY